jgi:hypothetical protein
VRVICLGAAIPTARAFDSHFTISGRTCGFRRGFIFGRRRIPHTDFRITIFSKRFRVFKSDKADHK